MASDPWKSVAEVAKDLELSPVVVREHLVDGSLDGRRLGRQWLVDARSVDAFKRNRPQPGRPMAPGMAWSVLLAASGDRSGAQAAAGSERAFYRALQWLREHSLIDDRSRLRRRAVAERFDVHPAEAARVSRSADVLRSGLAAGRAVGLIGGGQVVDVYAAASHRDELVDRHGLIAGDGPMRIRWLPDELWPLLDDVDAGVAPRAAVLIDLLEADDPRARREARRALAALQSSQQ